MLSAIDVLSHRDAGPTAGEYTNTGLNPYETTLTLKNVNPTTFGKLSTTPVDGQVYAQVLIDNGVDVTVGPEPGIHTVAVVATENDSLYAIDAETGVVLWHDSFINPSAGITPVYISQTGVNNVQPEIGITSTPVINPANGVIYVMAHTAQVESNVTHFLWTLHAINISNGAEALGGPTVVGDTIYNDLGQFSGNPSFTYVSGPEVPGTGSGSVDGMVQFNAWTQDQRASLTLNDGVVYAGFAYGGIGPYHGWLLGYSASTLKLVAVFCTTPNGDDGGVWQSGSSVDVDSQGYMYIVTGNGIFDETLNAQGFPIKGDYGDSVIKLAVDPTSSASHPNQNGWGLKVVDYFTPDDQLLLDDDDKDLGSGGITLLPTSMGSASDPNLMVAEGKLGEIYLINCDNMGKFNPNGNNVVGEISDGGYGEFNSAAVFGNDLYYIGVKDSAQVYKISNATIQELPKSHTTLKFVYPGATPMVSSNGSKNAILWAIDLGTNTLRAYSANNVRELLYSSSQAKGNRDALGQAVKFTVPTIDNGKVYVGTSNSVDIYGLRSSRRQQARRRR